jgi:hypothetical protein
VFIVADAAAFERDASMIPAVFRPILDAAQDLATKGWAGGDSKQLIARVDALRATDLAPADAFRAQYTEFMRREKSGHFWPQVVGTFDDARKYILALNLADGAAMVRNTPAGKATMGLRFPLPGSLDTSASGYEVCAWLDLAGKLTRRTGVPQLIFWNQRGTTEDPAVCVFHGPPTPRTLLPLWRPALDTDHIWDLAKGDAARAAQGKSRYASVLDNPDTPLGDMLARLGQ